MSNEYICCECGFYFSEDNFKNHLKLCDKFKSKYKDFDYKLGKLLRNYANSDSSLIHIKYSLQAIIKIIKENNFLYDNKINNKIEENKDEIEEKTDNNDELKDIIN